VEKYKLIHQNENKVIHFAQAIQLKKRMT